MSKAERAVIIDCPELEAPCRWCGYSGSGYWQAGTHAEDCPWRRIGGEASRELIVSLLDAGLSTDDVAECMNGLRAHDRTARYRRTGP